MKQPLARPAGTCTVRPVISRTSRSPACEVASPSACEVASSSGPRRVRLRGAAGEGAAEAGQEGTSDGTRRVRTPFRGGSGGARPDHDRSCTAAGDAQLPLRTSVSSAESHSGDLPANDSAILVRRSKPPAPSLGSPGHREDACSRSAALLGQLATGLAHESVRRIEARLLGGTAGHRSRSSVRPAVTPDDTRAHRRKIRKAPEAQPARLTGRPGDRGSAAQSVGWNAPAPPRQRLCLIQSSRYSNPSVVTVSLTCTDRSPGPYGPGFDSRF